MTTFPRVDTTFHIRYAENTSTAIAARECQKSLMLRTWILSGLFFMALSGTLLGFSNLMVISTHHRSGSLPELS